MGDYKDHKDIACGIAALSICESLLIALSDLEIMSPREIDGVLGDAVEVHRNAGGTGEFAAMHCAVADIIERIMSGHDALEHPGPGIGA